MPQVPITLKIEPEVGSHPEESLQAQGCIGGHTTLAMHDLVKPRIGDAEPARSLGERKVVWLDELLQQHLTGMRGGAILWQSGHELPFFFSDNPRFRLVQGLLPSKQSTPGTRR